MNTDVTFLVNSCDKYEDAWEPFFRMFHIMDGGKGKDVQFVLNTETKQYSCDFLNVRTVNSPPKMTWSQRELNVLSTIETEFVFFLLDDYFIKAPFGWDRFNKVIDYMKVNPDVGLVDLRPRWAATLEEAEKNLIKYQDAPDDYTVREGGQYNITCSPYLWRTSVLVSLLRPHEDIWAFEKYVGVRANNHDIKVIRYNTHTPTIYEYEDQIYGNIGITYGKWLPGTVEFFEKYEIEIDFKKLGVLPTASLNELSKMKKRNIGHVLRMIKRRIRMRAMKSKSLY